MLDHASRLDAILKDVSRSFYLSLRFLPKSVRPGLSLAYLLARASDTLADAEGLVAEERLTELSRYQSLLTGALPWAACQADWQRIASKLQHEGESKLLPAVGEILELTQSLSAEEQAAVRQVLETILAGQVLDVQRFPDASQLRWLNDPDSLLDYTYRVAGCVGGFWTQMLALREPKALLKSPAEMQQLGIKLGQGLQLVNITRDLAGDMQQGRCYLPRTEFPPDLADRPSEEALRSVRDRWLDKAAEFLAAGEEYTRNLKGWRLRFTADLPRRLAHPTLAIIRSSPAYGPKLKIGRPAVRKAAFAALWQSIF